MASYDEHVKQVKHNLSFLVSISQDSKAYWDWRVTVAFYTSVHLVNAHLAQAADQHYRSHQDVSVALNPFIGRNTALPRDVFLSYEKLSNLSRRSRYLIKENLADRAEEAQLTYDKHLAKALRYLSNIEDWFNQKYGEVFDVHEVFCLELKTCKYFNQKKVSQTV